MKRPVLLGAVQGSSAIEFAVAAPVLLLLIFGVLQIGQLLEAKAGLKFGMDETARFAGIYPRPTDSAIQAKFDGRRFGLKSSLLTSPTIVHGTGAGGDYVDISATYSVQSQFVFFTGPVVTLTETRRAYQP